MRVLRRRCAERAQDVDLPRGVVEVVVAADDAADAHVHVVHHHGEVVGGRAVAAREHQVVEFAVAEGDVAADEVVHHHFAVGGVAKTHHRRRVARRRRGEIPAAAVVARLFLARELRLAPGGEIFGRAVAAVGVAGIQQVIEHLPVSVEALGLVERPLVVVQTQPGHAFQDGVDRFLGGALAVGVLDAQDEGAAVVARVQPGEQRRAGATDVQIAGGTWGEAAADAHEKAGTKRAGRVL